MFKVGDIVKIVLTDDTDDRCGICESYYDNDGAIVKITRAEPPNPWFMTTIDDSWWINERHLKKTLEYIDATKNW